MFKDNKGSYERIRVSGDVRMEGEVKWKTDSTLLPLKIKEVSISQRIQAVSRNWKMDSPPGPPE